MSKRITAVHLNGFKGQSAKHTIGAATLIQGPNGTGKSAVLQALTYAVTGQVPAGKTLDAVALYFSPRGGEVTIYDANNQWLSRGITIDHEKAKVSEVLASSVERESGGVDLDYWASSEFSLNIADFLGLSPAKKREFVLSICGGGTPDQEAIRNAIALNYARAVAGPAAKIDTLLGPEDLPEHEANLCDEWTRDRGIDEILQSHLTHCEPDATTSSIRLQLSAEAKQQRLSNRRAAIDAKAAIRELEAEAQGARAAAEEIAEIEAEVIDLRNEMQEAKENRARFQEAQQSLAAARERLFHAKEERDRAKHYAANATAPGPEPDRPKTASNARDLRNRIASLQEDYRAQQSAAAAIDEHHKTTVELKNNLLEANAELLAIDAEDIGRAVTIIKSIPDSIHPSVKRLRQVIETLSAGWVTRQKKARSRIGHIKAKLAELKRIERKQPDAKGIERKLSEIHAEISRVSETLKAVELQEEEAQATYEDKIYEWRKQKSCYDKATEVVTTAAVALESAEQQEEAARERLRELEKPDDISAIETKLTRREEDLRRAQKAVGAVAAYDEAVQRAERSKIAEEAWKLAERAIADATEELIGAATRDLLSDINAVLEQAGRAERAYLLLENQRGRPIFELGWTANGTRTSFQALSGGEAALFAAALSLAITSRANGRKILLVEADPLDQHNLLMLLKSLQAFAGKLDALLVATAREGIIESGWELISTNGT